MNAAAKFFELGRTRLIEITKALGDRREVSRLSRRSKRNIYEAQEIAFGFSSAALNKIGWNRHGGAPKLCSQPIPLFCRELRRALVHQECEFVRKTEHFQLAMITGHVPVEMQLDGQATFTKFCAEFMGSGWYEDWRVEEAAIDKLDQ